MKIIIFFSRIIILILIILFRILAQKYIKISSNKKKKDIFINEDFLNELIEPVTYYEKIKGKNIRNIIIRDLAKYANVDDQIISPLIKYTNRMHTASLVIDDIQDNSLIRRNHPCAHVVYGIPYSISAAYTQVFKCLYEIANITNVPVSDGEWASYLDKFDEKTIKRLKSRELINITIENIYKAHLGQEMEVYWTYKKKIPTIEEYLIMVEYKTCVIFMNVIDLANIYQQLENKNYDEYRDIFKKFGIFFQIRDDYINLTSPSFWKEKGFCEDFDEKKYSYVVICYWHSVKDDEKNKFIELFDKKDLTVSEKIDLLKMINETNVFDNIYKELVEYKKELEKHIFFSSIWEKLPFEEFDISYCERI